MTTLLARAPIQALKWARNNKLPDAVMQSQLSEMLNQATRFRLKEIARFGTPIANIPSAGGASRVRWRVAAAMSPQTDTLYVRVVLAMTPHAGGSSPSTVVNFYEDAAMVDLIDSGEFHFGSNPLAAADTPAFFGIGSMTLDVSGMGGGSEIYGEIIDTDDARCVSITIYEGASVANLLNESYATGSPIYDADRSAIATAARSQWKHGAAHLWNWSVENDAPRTRTSATPINAIDNSSTAVSAASPGVTLDLRYATTVRRGTVPCMFKVYAAMPSGVGIVYLKDSTGASVVELDVDSTTSTAAQWWSIACDLPATLAKYDIMYSGNGTNQVSLYAASLYQYEA